MANSTLDTELIILQDNWPTKVISGCGPTRPTSAVDASGWQGQNVAAPTDFEVGTKFTIHNAGGTSKPIGESTFIYLRLGTQNADILLSCVAASDKCVCCPETLSADGTAAQMYQVTNDGDGTTMEPTGLIAVGLSAMTNTYYGWFWCGGVAPLDAITGLVGNFRTLSTVAIGEIVISASDLANHPLGITTTAAGSRCCGTAFKAET